MRSEVVLDVALCVVTALAIVLAIVVPVDGLVR